MPYDHGMMTENYVKLIFYEHIGFDKNLWFEIHTKFKPNTE